MRTGNKEWENVKKLNFIPERSICKAGAKGNVAVEVNIKKETSALYRNKKKDALRASQRPARIYLLLVYRVVKIQRFFEKTEFPSRELISWESFQSAQPSRHLSVLPPW